MKDSLNKVTSELDKPFEYLWNVSFKEGFQNHYGLVPSTIAEANRQLQRKSFKKCVNIINSDLVKTSVHRLYGNPRQSMASWDRERMIKSYESIPDATSLTLIKEDRINSGLQKPKNHVGLFSSYQIDSGILDDAASWTSDDLINFTEIGKKYIKKDGKFL